MSEKTEELFEKLSAPFTRTLEDGTVVPDLHWRILSAYEVGKDKVADITPYIKVEQVSDRLNETLGVLGWETTYEEMGSDKALICNLTIHFEGKKITKSGIGTSHNKNSNIDADKTRESDSLKRAAIKFGIGMYVKKMIPIILPSKKQGKNTIVFTKSGNLLPTPKDISNYINGINSNKLKFTEILRAIPKEKQAEIKPHVKRIWDLLTS